MPERTKPGYSLRIHPQSGIVERLSVRGDPAGANLVNRGYLTGFGGLCWTPRAPNSARMSPSGPPFNVEAVHLDERRSFAPVAEESADRVVCRNPITGHTLTYELADDHFDLWLEGALSEADGVGLDLDVAFMDLRQNDPPEWQYTVQCPYRSEDRSLCYVYLARPRPPGMLIACLTPAAGWRLRYGRNGCAPFAFRLPMHAVLGLQMLARFDSALDPASRPGPVRFGVRISFPRDLAEARARIVDELSVPLLSAPTLGGEVGTILDFQVDGPAAGAELVAPDGRREPVELRGAGGGASVGEVALRAEGFHLLRAWNSAGRGSDLVLHAGAPWLETLRRSLSTLDPIPPSNAEGSYWAHAMSLARSWLGPDPRQDALLHDALVRIHMQGLSPAKEPPAAPGEPTTVARGMPRREGCYLGAPCPEPHDFRGKRFSPFHLFEHDRVQDAFALIQLYLLAATSFGRDEFLDHAVRVAEAHIADNIDASGRVYCLTADGRDTHDYTTVIAPLQALVDLVVELERRGDGRAGSFRETSRRVADFLVRRGLDFPTEGVPPHVRWTEDGSIACTALSLLYAYHFLDRRPEYLESAGRVLDYHEPWGLDVPDVRMNGSSYRYWETQWEGDREGRAINAGHAWTLWRAEALYYWALATGDARRLVQSWNGYRTNFCKFQPDGRTFACFTPDFVPDRPRRFALAHRYPEQTDHSLAFYLWPRAAGTWMRTAAVVSPSAAGCLALRDPVALGGRLVRTDRVLELVPAAPFHDRLFLLAKLPIPLRVRTPGPVEILFAPAGTEIVRGKRSEAAGPGAVRVEPQDGAIELRAGEA